MADPEELPPGIAPVAATRPDDASAEAPPGFAPVNDGADTSAATAPDPDKQLAVLFNSSLRDTPDRRAGVLRLARDARLPSDVVDTNYDKLKQSWETAQFDPGAWRKANPELAKLTSDRPELAGLVVRDQQLSAVSQLLNKQADLKQWLADATGVDLDTNPVLQYAGTGLFQALGNPLDVVKRAQQAFAGTKGEEIRAGDRRQPQAAETLDDQQAKEVRDASFLTRPARLGFARFKETLSQMELSQAQFQLMTDRATGRDTFELEKHIVDLERQSTPRDYRETASEQVLSDIAQAAGSEVPVLASAGIAGIAGAGAGALVGGVATKSPAGARAFALQGAKWGGRAGLALGSFKLEAGQEYGSLLKAKTDAGVPLSEAEARGGAIIYGAAATAVEMWSTEQFLKSVGPLGTALRTGSGKAAVAELLTKDAGFRQLATRIGQAWGKEALSEGGEEFTQQVLQGLTDYFSKSHAAGQLQPFKLEDTSKALGEAFTAGEKGLVGGFGLGAAGSTVHLTTQMIAMNKAQAAGVQVAALAQLAGAESPTVKAAPEAVANMVAEATLNQGEAVTHLYVDAGAFQRLFQSENDSGAAHQAAAQLLGPDGPRQLQEALATGQKLEVPVADYLERWGGTEAAEKLAEDTTTSPTLATPREANEAGPAIRKRADELAAEFKKDEAPPPLPAERQALDQLEAQVKATGQFSDKQVRDFLAVHRGEVTALAERSGIPAAQLLREFQLRFAKGDETTAPANALEQGPVDATAEFLSRRADQLSPEERVRETLIDSVSGLRNRKAFDTEAAPNGQQLAVITSPDVKGINDHPTAGGHDVANGLLRRIGSAIGETHPTAARSSTNFLLHVKDRAELDQVLQRAREAVGQGISLRGALGGDKETAFKALDRSVEQARKYERLPPRGQVTKGVDVGALRFDERRARAEAPAAAAAEIGQVKGQEYFDRVYRTPEGLLTREAWDAIPKKKHTAALDMRGLKAINTEFGSLFGDAVLSEFRRVAVEAGGVDFDMAHLSGDEFAAQSDNLPGLQGFLVALYERVDGLKLTGATLAGAIKTTTVDFRHGLAETYGEADRDLNAAKRAEPVAEGGAARSGALRRLEGRPAAAGRPGQANYRSEVPGAGTRLEQPADGGSIPRGYTEFAREGLNRIFKIAVNRKADVSTLLHESAHVFLEVMGDLAERPDVREGLKADYRLALKYLGAKDRAGITRDMHEKFARSFERYLFEGKAPSADLAAVFERFKLWLTRVYRSLAGVNVELNDDIRGVFDRLLATDQQLEEARRSAGVEPVFKSPAEAGMSAEQWEGYLRAQERAVSSATRGAELRLLKERLRGHERWWKDETSAERDQAELDYEELPARRAQLALRGKHADFASPISLDRHLVTQAVGADAAKRFITRRDGVAPDEMAEALGFPTGEAMLKSIVALPEKATWADQQAERNMAAKHPSLLDDQQKLREQISKALHSDETARWFHRELMALERQAKRPLSDPGFIDSAKLAAMQIVDGRRVGQLHPAAALQAERSGARRVAELAAKKDFAAAVQAQKQRILNMFIYRELLEAREERESFEQLTSQLKKTKSRERLGKASPVYRDGVDMLLESFGLTNPGPREGPFPSVHEVVETLRNDATTIGFDEAELTEMLAKRGWADWKGLRVAKLRTLSGALKTIQAAARFRTTVLLDEKRVDKELVKTELIAEAKANLRSRGALASSPAAATLAQQIGQGANALAGYLLQPERLVKDLSGDNPKSMWQRAVIEPLQQGKHREADLLRTAIEPIVKQLNDAPAKVRNSFNDRVDGQKLFPTHRVDGELQIAPPTRKFELFVMLLNAGNESNLSRLLEGRGITEQQLNAALELLPKEYFELAQSVWDSAEQLRPLAFELEERDSGVRPEAIKARPLPTRFGTYRGGYFPAIYDRRVELAGEHQVEEQIGSLFDPSFVREGTARGHLQGRVEGFSGAIKLDLGEIHRHLVQVAHDIAFREPVKSVANLLFDPDVQGVLRDRLGVDVSRRMVAWVRDVARMRGVDQPGPLLTVFRTVKSNTVTSALGFKFLLGLEDFVTAMGTSLAKGVVKPQHLAAAAAEFATRPFEFIAAAKAQSGEVRARLDHLQRDLVRRQKQLTLGKSSPKRAVLWLQSHAFVFQEAFDRMSSSIVWTAAQHQALAAGESPESAELLANAAVRDVLPSHSPVDTSAITRDKGAIGLLLQFHGFFNHALNQLYDILRPVRQAEGLDKLLTAPKVAGEALAFLMVISVISSLARAQGPDDKSEEGWGAWFVRKTIGTILSLAPFGGDFSQMFERWMLGKDPTPKAIGPIQAGFALTKAIGEAPDEDKDFDKRLLNLIRALGPVTGLPTGAIAAGGQGVEDFNAR